MRENLLEKISKILFWTPHPLWTDDDLCLTVFSSKCRKRRRRARDREKKEKEQKLFWNSYLVPSSVCLLKTLVSDLGRECGGGISSVRFGKCQNQCSRFSVKFDHSNIWLQQGNSDKWETEKLFLQKCTDVRFRIQQGSWKQFWFYVKLDCEYVFWIILFRWDNARVLR